MSLPFELHSRARTILLFSFLSACGGGHRGSDRALPDAGPDADADADSDSDSDSDSESTCPDFDEDGWPSDACGGEDCDDTDAAIHPGAPEGWLVETVDTSEAALPDGAASASGLLSLVVAPDGVVHFTYFDVGAQDLRHATNASGEWEVEIVDGDGWVGEYGSAALDADGALHLAYFDRTNGDLRYATNAGGDWEIEVVDAEGSTGRYTGIDVDAAGAVHVVYLSYDGQSDLRYATNAGGAWALSTIDAEADHGQYAEYVLDASGVGHCTYFQSGDESPFALFYATDASGEWVRETIDPNMDGGASSLAVDASGFVHVVYGDIRFSGPPVRHATNASGAWEIETIAESGSGPSIAIGPAGLQVVELERDVGADRVDVVFLEESDGAWQREVVDTVPVDWEPGSGTAITLDGAGRTHVAYDLESADGRIEQRHAIREPPNGVDDDCDGEIW